MAKQFRRVAAALVAAGALTAALPSAPASARRVPCLDDVPACARIALSGVPKQCRTGSFVADVRLDEFASFETVELRLDGRLQRRSEKLHFKVTIRCSELRRGPHTVQVAALPREHSPWGVAKRDFTALP